MRIVAISILRSVNEYVLRQLHGSHQVAQILRPMREQSLRSYWSKCLRSPLRAPVGLLRRSVYAHLNARLDAKIRSLLFYPEDLPALPVVTTIGVAEINGAQVENILQSLAPDLLVVSGAPLLKPEIFSLPRYGTINIHFGISPDYRGSHTLFYPLYWQDYSHLGVTLHYIDKGIDTGPIVAQGFPELGPSDDLASIWAKCAKQASTLLIGFVAAAAKQRVIGQRQARGGRLIQAKDRKLRHDVHFLLNRSLRRIRPPKRTARLVTYY